MLPPIAIIIAGALFGAALGKKTSEPPIVAPTPDPDPVVPPTPKETEEQRLKRQNTRLRRQLRKAKTAAPASGNITSPDPSPADPVEPQEE